jgi:cellulose synthase/poly-beta-1,6-N-acetylglucosamine synthase-like glycosyltransferase
MTLILGSLCLALALTALVLAAFYALEVTLAFVGPKPTARGAGGPLAILVPAHDEDAVIGATLASIAAARRPEDRVLVVADNCSDRTADIARASGAEVLVRNDTTRRGKGYALQYAIDSLRSAPPAGVVVIDADCALGPGAFAKIAAEMEATGRPAQMLCLMRAPEGAPPQRRIAEFAWILINKVRMRGLQRLSGGARLTGAGTALPWSVAERIDLASGEIVEDLALSVRLTAQGAAPTLVEDALVESVFPAPTASAVTQRARWENGSLRLAMRVAPGLLLRALTKGDFRLFCAALDLAVPPMTVFGALLAVVAFVSLAPALWGDFAPLTAAFAASVLFVAATIAAWVGFGREALPLEDLAATGAYLRDKVSVYFGAGRRSAKTWTRTARDGAEKGPGA